MKSAGGNSFHRHYGWNDLVTSYEGKNLRGEYPIDAGHGDYRCCRFGRNQTRRSKFRFELGTKTEQRPGWEPI